MPEDSKIYENRVRRMAERQGMSLAKSRRRDPRAVDYGTYRLVNARTNAVVLADANTGFGYTLDDIERHLLGAT